MEIEILFSEDVVVDVDNNFSFRGISFKIPAKNMDYHVSSRYDKVDDYENRSIMDMVTVGLGVDMQLYFFNESGYMIHGVEYQK